MTNEENTWGQWREVMAGSVRLVSVIQASAASFFEMGLCEAERVDKGQGRDVPGEGTDLVLQRRGGCYTLSRHY